MEKKEIAIAKLQNQPNKLILESLPETSRKYLDLHFGTFKIRDYKEKDLKGLYKFLITISKFIGITEPPEQDVMILTIDHLQEHHSDFSQEEIRRAFSMATAGKLGFKFEVFNKLTPQLVSVVLNAYKRLRGNQVMEYRSRLAKEQAEKESKDKQPSEHERAILKTQKAIEYMNARSINKPFVDWGNIVFLFLEKIGCIRLTEDQKEEIRKEAREEIIRGHSVAEAHGMRGLIKELRMRSPHDVSSVARQIALEKYFDGIIELGVDLQKTIDTAINQHGNVENKD
jgi:hypothetical protein